MKIKQVVLGIVLVLFVSCAGQNPVGEPTVKVEGVRKSGFLEDYSILQKGGEDGMNLVYVNSKTDFAHYDKIIVDPLTIWLSPKSNLSKVLPKERQNLANELHAVIVKEFKKNFQIVNIAGPGTMRFRVALIDVKESDPTLDTISTYIPQVRLLQAAATIGSETAAFVGEASAEAEARDAQTGELLGAVVARRAGTKALGDSTFDSWDDARRIFKKWAEQVRMYMEKRRGK
ncbi:MAG: DUF3313 domain-containing protein [Deltaproteobacteria bacterium]|nr:DUF3313 domain-containing protein [Deltaproteobacteria bacterium]